MRELRGILIGVVVLGAVAAGCASAPGEAPGAGGTSDGGASDGSQGDDGAIYAAFTTILQASEDVPPELCLAGVAESYPPQCGGLELIGLDWVDVADAETASGVTWGTAWVVGSYDAAAGSFTLTQPAAATAPEGVELPEPVEPEFEPLCEDPYRDGDEGFDDASADGMAAREDLTTAASGLEGYIGLYVSDGDAEFNVLVQGDAEAAHAQLREVWPGWLCVATHEGAAEADLVAAQEAVQAELGDQVLSSGAGGADGVLHVGVTVADDATTQAVVDVVERWLTPDQVEVTGALIEVTQG